MEEQFISYNLALDLKELGFNEECLAFYSAYPKEERKFMIVSEFRIKKELYIKNDYGLNTVTAPLWSQVFDWFREKYSLHVLIQRDWEGDNVLGFSYQLDEVEGNIESITYNSYDEARQACLEKLIEICKNK